MDDQQEEFERFEPQGEFPPKEPRDPFFADEMLEPSHKPISPSVKSLHIPRAPLNVEKVHDFLQELRPIIVDFTEVSRSDQHYLAMELQNVKNALHSAEFSEDMIHQFEKIVNHFNHLLTHSTPLDQTAVLKDIDTLEAML